MENIRRIIKAYNELDDVRSILRSMNIRKLKSEELEKIHVKLNIAINELDMLDDEELRKELSS